MNDLKQFEEVICVINTSLNSADRKAAEKKLNGLRKDNPLLFFQSLLKCAIESKDESTRQQCIVLFRQNCEPNKDVFTQKIAQSQWQYFENGLISAMSRETNRLVYVGICVSIGTLASRIVIKGGWKDLLPTLLKMTETANSRHREGFLIVLGCLAEYAMETIESQFGNIRNLIKAALTDSDATLRLAAFKTFSTVVIGIEGTQLNDWYPLVPLCLDLINTKDESSIQQCCAFAIRLCHRQPLILSNVRQTLISTAVALTKSANLEFDTRRLGLEILVSLAETSGIRKDEKYCSVAVQMCCMFLTMYDDDISFDDASEDAEQSFIESGSESIRELSTKLGPKIVMHHCQSVVIDQWLLSQQNSDNWKQLHAALLFIRYCLPQIQDLDSWQPKANSNLSVVISRLCQLIVSHPKPQLQYAALRVVTDCLDFYQTKFVSAFGKPVLETLGKVVSNALANATAIHWRVLEQTLECISHWNAVGNKAIMIEYADPLLTGLSKVLSSSQFRVSIQECAVTAIGTTANVLGDSFTKYYSSFMKVTMAIVEKASDDKLQKLRGKSMECVGLMGQSVGAVRFAEDAQKLMQMLLPLRRELESRKSGDTTAYNYLNHLFARICKTIGGESFSKYFAEVIPHILKSASVEAGCVTRPDEAATSTDADTNFTVVTMHLHGVGDATLAINPVSLDEKVTACNMLFQFVKDEPLGFSPYALQTVKVITPLMRYPYHCDVRIAATAITPLLLRSIVVGCERKTMALDGAALAAILDDLIGNFMQALLLEPDFTEQIPLLEVLTTMISVVSQSRKMWNLSDKHLKEIGDVLQALLNESTDRRRRRMAERLKRDLDVDEKLLDEFEYADEMDGNLVAYCIDVVEWCFRCVGDRFSPVFDEYIASLVWNQFVQNKDCSVCERLQGLCFFIDAVEMGGQSPQTKYGQMVYALLSDAYDNVDLDIRQTAIYGIGSFAECACLPNAVSQWLPELVKKANQMRKHIDSSAQKQNNNRSDGNSDDGSSDDENQQLTILDNLISAIGKILRHASSSTANLNDSELSSTVVWWVEQLPITEDHEEMNMAAHNLLALTQRFNLLKHSDQLCQRILFSLYFYVCNFKTRPSKYETIMNPRLPKKKVPLLTPDVIRKALSFIKQCKQSMSPQIVSSAENRLSPQEKLNFTYISQLYPL